MSTRAKLTLATTTCSAIGIVVFVHMQQKADKAVLSIPPIVDAMDWSLTYLRQCTPVSFEIWSSKRSSANDRWTLRCRGSWRRSIERYRMLRTETRDEIRFIGLLVYTRSWSAASERLWEAFKGPWTFPAHVGRRKLVRKAHSIRTSLRELPQVGRRAASALRDDQRA